MTAIGKCGHGVSLTASCDDCTFGALSDSRGKGWSQIVADIEIMAVMKNWPIEELRVVAPLEALRSVREYVPDATVVRDGTPPSNTLLVRLPTGDLRFRLPTKGELPMGVIRVEWWGDALAEIRTS